MAERVFGQETEYALTAYDRGGLPACRDAALARLLQAAVEEFRTLCGIESKGYFLENGSRLYADAGSHPELATPECSDPRELVRYVAAGDRIVDRLARAVPALDAAVARAAVFRANVDYSGTGATWGCHESYLHRCDRRRLYGQLLPHLASRIVYTGAGGFNPLARGIEFLLSPRVAHLQDEVTSDSTHNRGMIHTKDEPLSAGGAHRLHLICGESLGSHRAIRLKFGTTALILALSEAGIEPAGGLRLAVPLAAMKEFARDPSLRARVKDAAGAEVSAIDIQRRYLEVVERALGGPLLPSWAEEVCRDWREVLDALESSPSGLDGALDWRLKLLLYEDEIRRRGHSLETLARWNAISVRLQQSLQRPPAPAAALLGVERLLARRGGPATPGASALDAALRNEGVSRDEAERFFELRSALCAADFQFAQLGEEGIFNGLDRQGVLRHRLVEEAQIEAAVRNPPASTRARLRGEWVRRLGGKGSPARCDWSVVWDVRERKKLDLSDPLAREERWSELQGPKPPPGPPPTPAAGSPPGASVNRWRMRLAEMFGEGGLPWLLSDDDEPGG